MAADTRKPRKKAKSHPELGTGAPVKDPAPLYAALRHPEADAERDASWPAGEKVAMLA